MLEWLFGKSKEESQQDIQKKKKKEKKSKIEQEKQDKWMYQFLVQFLNSPIWRVSILDFVDNNCLIFDNEQQNKFQYTKIHSQFKEMVGTMFDGMMNQIGLDEDKLAELIEYGFQSKQKKLFAQLLLCDDFIRFKQIMVKRNKTLQQEAIKAFKGQGSGQVRTSKYQLQKEQLLNTKRQEQQRKKKLQDEEQQILRKVLEMSKKQAQQQEAIKRLEKVALENQIAQSIRQSQLPKQEIKQQIHHKNIKQKQIHHENIKEKSQEFKPSKPNQNSKNTNIQKTEQIKKSTLPPVKNKPYRQNPISHSFKQQQQTKKTQFRQQKEDFIPQVKPKEQMIPQTKHETEKQVQKQKQDLQSQQNRKKRLLEQREKIRKKKQQQRKKMLQQSQMGKKPPTVNIVLQDDGIHDTHVGQINYQKEEKVSKQEIERRKQLMKRIKNRIVDDL